MIDRDLANAYQAGFADIKAMEAAGYNPNFESDWERWRLGLPPFTEPDWLDNREAVRRLKK